jgi:hypothetical protein
VASAVLLQAHHAGQVDLGKPFKLLREAGLSAPEGLAARTQFLWQPVASVGPLQRMPDGLWMGQELAEILLDEGLDLLGRDKPGGAWGVAVGV